MPFRGRNFSSDILRKMTRTYGKRLAGPLGKLVAVATAFGLYYFAIGIVVIGLVLFILRHTH